MMARSIYGSKSGAALRRIASTSERCSGREVLARCRYCCSVAVAATTACSAGVSCSAVCSVTVVAW